MNIEIFKFEFQEVNPFPSETNKICFEITYFGQLSSPTNAVMIISQDRHSLQFYFKCSYSFQVFKC